MWHFVVLLSHNEKKCFLRRNLATTLPLKSNLSEKFQSVNAIDVSGVKIFSYGYLQEFKNICFASALRMQFLGV